MKTFKDLKFKPHLTGDGLQARMDFDNGYGVSVVRFKILGGYGSYTNNDKEWELAVLFNDELCYDTPITNDVIGWLSAREVTKIMKQVQELTVNMEVVDRDSADWEERYFGNNE